MGVWHVCYFVGAAFTVCDCMACTLACVGNLFSMWLHGMYTIWGEHLAKMMWFAGTKYNFAKLWKDYAAYGNIEEV